ncbi:MAG: 5'/3'-nucleotidase SurE [Microthrixaceae bacterium]
MRTKHLGVILAALVLLTAACSSDSDSEDAGSTTTTAASDQSTSSTTAAPEETEKLTVLVTNDDGVSAEGIDALTQVLSGRDDVELVVVAPAENQSGSGGKTTAGPLSATETTTASGLEATAVAGFPADSVIWALDEGGITPGLVISGVNDGQNIGALVPLSGTVGAARQAAQMGVPAIAVSQGLGDPPDFDVAVAAAMEWLDQNIEALLAGEVGTDSISNINAPTCPTGEVQGEVEVPVAVDSTIDVTKVDCAGTADPVDDVVAFTNGWIALSVLAPTGSITE